MILCPVPVTALAAYKLQRAAPRRVRCSTHTRRRRDTPPCPHRPRSSSPSMKVQCLSSASLATAIDEIQIFPSAAWGRHNTTTRGQAPPAAPAPQPASAHVNTRCQTQRTFRPLTSQALPRRLVCSPGPSCSRGTAGFAAGAAGKMLLPSRERVRACIRACRFPSHPAPPTRPARIRVW